MAKKKIGVTLDENIHLQVKSEAPRRKMNVEAAYEEALQLWLGALRDPGSAHMLPTHYQPEIELLSFILENGAPEEAEGIRVNLRMFAEAIRARGKAKRKRERAG
jgi:hypothetical protein